MDFDYRNKLEEVRRLLDAGNESVYVDLIDRALDGGNGSSKEFLVSNELWGGSGSIADNCLLDKPVLRKQLMLKLVELGDTQIAGNFVNPRTRMWTSTFRQWIDQGIV